jgi:pimeloyl-ACP methyl ester carboxylesterase
MARFDQATGRYIHLAIDGVDYRVYFEEHGSGIPLLLQHTAGGDGRQWRHVLEDAALARQFRMIAYDLPYHGKSVPPAGVQWWRQEYRLTKDFLMQVPVTLARELALERPVFMGSSIGGHLAVDLALHHPDDFRAVIGLEAAAYTPGAYLDLWYHPRISNDFKASVMFGLMSPSSPEPLRRETAWGYSQGAPPVFKGDLYYFSIDHDLRETARQIDTARVAVYLLTGEYDWAATPAMSRELARQIPGAFYRTMEGLGHFPMSEDPARFLDYVRPVLDEIRMRAAVGR